MSGIPAGAGQLLGKRLGKFEILALLALGGTAEIYLARIGGAAGFEKYVVVKCLHDHLADDAEFVKMFLDEARLAAHLDHSNIVQTMELGQHDGRYYMVMEFLAGLSLAMIVRRANERLPNERIPVPLVLNVLAQSCAGLHYAHEKSMNGKPLGIVHRDISPQNLVISFEGVVKIVDFGIAKAELRETRTRSGTIKGKFAYMSPEQCVANNVDRRTDVFALGVIAHELLTGRRLFKHPSPYETYQAVMECDVKPPSVVDKSIDPALDPVIMRALAKDKADRYPTAEAFGDALLGHLHHRGIGSGPGDVSRFFDAYFGQEIEEHSARMRELISGRDISVEAGSTWGADDDVDDGKPGGGVLAAMLDDMNSFGAGSRVEDDDELSTERTRIESNPLERINELDRVVAQAPRSVPPAPRPMPPGMPPSGVLLQDRFPDPSNVATMISDPADPPAVGLPPTEVPLPPTGLPLPPRGQPPAAPPIAINASRVPAASEGFSHAPTALAPSRVPNASEGFANAPTSLAPGTGQLPMRGAPSLPASSRSASSYTNAMNSLGVLPPAPSSIASSSNAPTNLAAPIISDSGRTQISPPPEAATSAPASSIAPPPGPGVPNGAPPGPSVPVPPPRPQSSSGPPPLPVGYPVMNAELSAQIAIGASVFPSERPPPGSAPPPMGHLPYPDSGFVDPQRAAEIMSPVGQQYPAQDWTYVANAPTRAPKWLLAVLFIAAIAVALGLTIAIARLAG